MITQPFDNLFPHSADRDTDISTAGCQVYRLSCLGKVNVKEAISWQTPPLQYVTQLYCLSKLLYTLLFVAWFKNKKQTREKQLTKKKQKPFIFMFSVVLPPLVNFMCLQEEL